MKYLIRQRGLYWRPHSSGYTNYISLAGIYNEKEAQGIQRNNREPPDIIIPLDADNKDDIIKWIEEEQQLAEQIKEGAANILMTMNEEQ